MNDAASHDGRGAAAGAVIDERLVGVPLDGDVEDGALPLPTRTVTAGNRRIGDLVDTDALAAQYADGTTLVLQSLHRLHPPVARFGRQLAAELGHATQRNAYLTPAGEHQGLDFHHDTHDVFVLQVSGRRRWVVHEPVVRLPLASQPESGARLVPAGAKPLLDVELEAGDTRYLPRGYVRAALTPTGEHSVHLTVGVLSTTCGATAWTTRAPSCWPAGCCAREPSSRRYPTQAALTG